MTSALSQKVLSAGVARLSRHPVPRAGRAAGRAGQLGGPRADDVPPLVLPYPPWQAEGLADLLGSQTSAQRRQALQQSGFACGTHSLHAATQRWRATLLRHLAQLEAAIDFVDDDIDSLAVLAEAGLVFVPAPTLLPCWKRTPKIQNRLPTALLANRHHPGHGC